MTDGREPKRKAAYHVAGWNQNRMKWLSVGLWIENVGETGWLESL